MSTLDIFHIYQKYTIPKNNDLIIFENLRKKYGELMLMWALVESIYRRELSLISISDILEKWIITKIAKVTYPPDFFKEITEHEFRTYKINQEIELSNDKSQKYLTLINDLIKKLNEKEDELKAHHKHITLLKDELKREKEKYETYYPEEYELLQISPRASKEIIEKAYRIMVNKYHPDKYFDEEKEWATKMMKKINNAYNKIKKRTE